MTLRAEALSRTAWIHSKPARLTHLELNAGHVKLGKFLLCSQILGISHPRIGQGRLLLGGNLHSTVKDMSVAEMVRFNPLQTAQLPYLQNLVENSAILPEKPQGP